jgi:Acyltransferase family
MSETVAGLVEVETKKPRQRDLSMDYLRTTLVLMVLGHHSSLAYTTFARFSVNPVTHAIISTAPVVDTTRWGFFDYAENFNDVFFMALMFFVSGVFVYSALKRHGTLEFLRDRFLRLGLPFAVAVTLWMPVAYYAMWQRTGMDRGYWNYYKMLAARGFIVGPPWFVWLLLFFDVILALLALPVQRWLPGAGRWMGRVGKHPVAMFVALFFLSAIAYIPLLARFGFGTWVNLVTSPFTFQISRVALYALWFVLGFLVGIPGLDAGLLARDGALARHWKLWMVVCVAAYNVLIFAPRLGGHWGKAEPLFWVASCVASCFGFLAMFRGMEIHSRAWMSSLSRCAYVMYLVHYTYVLWLQRLMLNRQVFAGVKFVFVFLGTVLLSWLTAKALLRVPKLRAIL